MNKATLSVIIVAKNEAHQIRECIDSVAFADEVLVLDSGSSDDTVAKAREAGATVHVTDWPGFGPQKARGVALASCDWVLVLDADERIGAALREEIEAVLSGPAADGYRLPRRSSLCGTFIEHGGWRPDYTLRLVRREVAGFSKHVVHEHMTCRGSTRDLSQRIVHYSYRDLDDVLAKLNRYSRDGATELSKRGITSGFARPLFSGMWSFVRTYLLRQGFRDGKMGLVLAIYNAETTYYKYLRLWMQGRGQGDK
ncbi:MAG: glycosyltransferase family 2 protein [Burkholderiales bacterium]